MIEQYLNLLTSFKENKTSVFINGWRKKFFILLISPIFNPRIKDFFAFALPPERINLGTGQPIDVCLFTNFQLNLSLLPEDNFALENFLNKPFTDFTNEPQPVIYLKQLLNALYHLEITFNDLENTDFSSYRQELFTFKQLFSHTVDHAYEASYLLTHMDYDFREIFHTEITILSDFFVQIKNYADGYKQTATEIAKPLKNHPDPRQTGKLCGIFIDQLQPNHDKFDYTFLAQFSAALPAYIDKCTSLIHEFTEYSDIKKFKRNISKNELALLQEKANALLASISEVQGSYLFISFKSINYIYIIQNIITIFTSILHELHNMRQESAEVIIKYLAQLKYEWLAKTLAFADKVEAETMLKPGFLSNPLLSSIQIFYNDLIRFVNTSITLDINGQHLSTLSDYDFIIARAKSSITLIKQHQQNQPEAEKMQTACTNFYLILSTKPAYTRLKHLNKSTKENLSKYYRDFQAQVEIVDPLLNSEIIEALSTSPDNFDKVSFIYKWIVDKTTDQIAYLLNQKNKIEKALAGKVATCQFKSNIYTDIVVHITQQNGIADWQQLINTTAINIIQPNTEEPALTLQPLALTNNQSLSKPSQYSAAIAEFKKSIFNFILIFNDAFKKKIQPAQFGLPFPEAESIQLLTETKQVLAIKRLYNILYHLEQTAYQLERLDLKSKKTVYVYHLLSAFGHLNKLQQLAKAIYFDNHLRLLGSKVMQNYNFLLQHCNNFDESYLIKEHTVEPKEVHVQNQGLWHTIEILNLLPKQIQALDRQTTLTPAEQQKIDNYSKKTVLRLERILNKSNSYFKLLFEVPVIYMLLTQLKQKILEFTAITHHALLSHISTINNEIFARILVEVDLLEDKIGLKPGHWSQPMKRFLSEFNKGLLEPLSLISQQQLDLADSAMVNKRIVSAINHHENNKQKLIGIKNSHNKIKSFVTAINEYKNLTKETNFLPPSPQIIFLAEKKLMSAFQTAEPIINQYGEIIELILNKQPSEIMTDSVLYATINDSLPRINNLHLMIMIIYQHYQYQVTQNQGNAIQDQEKITLLENFLDLAKQYSINQDQNTKDQLAIIYEKIYPIILAEQQKPEAFYLIFTNKILLEPALHNAFKDAYAKPDNNIPHFALFPQITFTAVMVEAFYQGIAESYQLKIDTAAEKLSFLTKDYETQLIENKSFIENFAAHYFDQQIELISKRKIDLVWTAAEYNQTLNNFLTDKKNIIVEQAVNSNHVVTEISNSLEKEAVQFHLEQLNDFMQLEKVHLALQQFDKYFAFQQEAISAGKACYENETTLRKKQHLIQVLREKIANNDQPIAARLAAIKEHVSDKLFIGEIMQTTKITEIDLLSVQFLKRCIYALLSALRLYTPEYLVPVNNLAKTVNTKPIITNEQRQRFLFFPQQSSYSEFLPDPVELVPAM